MTVKRKVFGRPQWLTPKGRSRQYVQKICRRIGEENIELGNACCRVVLRGGAKPNETPAGAVVQAGEAVVESREVAKPGDKLVAEEAGRWQVVDSAGNTRVFDEVRRKDIKESKTVCWYTSTSSLVHLVYLYFVVILFFDVSSRC